MRICTKNSYSRPVEVRLPDGTIDTITFEFKRCLLPEVKKINRLLNLKLTNKTRLDDDGLLKMIVQDWDLENEVGEPLPFSEEAFKTYVLDDLAIRTPTLDAVIEDLAQGGYRSKN